jgi:4-hydroxy-tetrahydrodipicolinate synthase
MSAEQDAIGGIVPPILTPLDPAGEVDLRSLARLVRYLAIGGVDGIWACGTTGEFACIDADEREHVIATVIETLDGKLPVIANVSDCSTRLAIGHARRADAAGADAIAVTPPYYYGNTQDEILAMYRTVRTAVDLPLYVYNIPSTVKTRIEIDTIVQLASEGTVAGIKDSQGDLPWARELARAVASAGVPLRIFLGSKAMTEVALISGIHGCIPGIANVVPRACVDAWHHTSRGNIEEARVAQATVDAAMTLLELTGGSRHARSFGGMKAALVGLRVIAHPTLASPLHTPTLGEVATVGARLKELGISFRA